MNRKSAASCPAVEKLTERLEFLAILSTGATLGLCSYQILGRSFTSAWKTSFTALVLAATLVITATALCLRIVFGHSKAEEKLPPRWMDYVFASFPPELRDEHIGNMTAHFDWCLKRRKSVIYAKTMCTIAIIGILVRLIPAKIKKAVIQHFIAPK